MAKGLREKGNIKAAEASHASSSEGIPGRDKLGILSYGAICVVFAAVCGLQILVIKIFTDATKGMFFFFGSLIIVFVIVAIYTWIYDTFSEDSPRSSGENS